ncbi:TIGR03086 family metal-binding protein [Streptomyces sp. NPDC042319]|uniref:TIGR03086 family metal-binding protein n=1 Tax=Streptomyces sp. NPDC042319 TaxID=3154332 RepID=UPI0033F1FD9C
MHNDEQRPMWSIGTVARKTGLPVKVIRHWSDLGVVPPAGRTTAGYRCYDAAAVARLQLARTLRDLGMGLGEIRAALDREDGLAEVAAAHVEALEAQIRRLRTHQAVLRTVTHRTTREGLALMTRTAHMSPDERRALIHHFLTETLDDLDVPHFREGLLAAGADLPENPADDQIEAWLELGELIAGGELQPAMRRMAQYAADHGPGEDDPAAAEEMRRLTDTWTAHVREAIDAGTAPDSPAADPVVAEIVAAWLPSRANTDPTVTTDGAEARGLLLEQLTAASEPAVERFWQLLCVLGGRPAPPSLARAGDWLTTALRANPTPGARATQLEALYREDSDPWPSGVLDACARVQSTVAALIRDTRPTDFDSPTPCGDWTVRDLLDHLVWENILWGGLAQGTPPTSGHTDDHLGSDHAAAFETAANEALTAFRQPGMLTRTFGPAPGRRLVEQLVIELLVHGWDLAAALGRNRDLLPDLARAALPVVREIYGDLPRTAGGSFGPPQPVPDDAPALDHLAGYLGREPRPTRSDRH